ncbi:MAG: hypothetical protein H8E48_07485 [Chloroflexi bacterium]|nr:hypothetical protein [Chloroflexota bacterium]
MGNFSNIRIFRLTFFSLIAIGLLAFAWGVTSNTVNAHGKELSATVSTLSPDPSSPLTRLYRVTVVYASDLDPVDGATVTLSATRVEGGPGLNELRLTELSGGEGLYVGEVNYSRFGTWEVMVKISGPFGQGNAESTFSDRVRPQPISAAQEEALALEAERVLNLQLFFKFSWWPDVVNILLRVVHSSAAIAYFAMTGLVLVMAMAGIPAGWSRLPANLHRVFAPVTVASLAILGASGMYSAAFDSPTTAPGLYDIQGILRLPYGEAYLAAFLVKPVAWGVMVYLAVQIGRELSWYAQVPIVGGGAAVASQAVVSVTPRLKRLALANVGVGVIMAIDVSLVIYLHYLSHLGVFLPPA